jgi:hypothetical protein
VGGADIWRLEGTSIARPSWPVQASSWLVAVIRPLEDSTQEQRYSLRIYHPAPCGPGFLVSGVVQDCSSKVGLASECTSFVPSRPFLTRRGWMGHGSRVSDVASGRQEAWPTRPGRARFPVKARHGRRKPELVVAAVIGRAHAASRGVRLQAAGAARRGTAGQRSRSPAFTSPGGAPGSMPLSSCSGSHPSG